MPARRSCLAVKPRQLTDGIHTRRASERTQQSLGNGTMKHVAEGEASVFEIERPSSPKSFGSGDGRLVVIATQLKDQGWEHALSFALGPALLQFARPVFPRPFRAEYQGHGDPNDVADLGPSSD
jgi:hypothetical protein